MVDVQPQVEAAVTTRKQLLAEGLFDLISERIISGELAPGMRIRDAELAAELAVSRTPVREALQRLERLGLVTMYPSRYTEVTPLTPEAVVVAHDFAGLQAGLIVRLACPLLTEAELDEACALIDEVRRTVGDATPNSIARRRMVGYLADRTGNLLQQRLLHEASIALARALRDYDFPAAHRPVMVAACAELERALRTRDRDAAELACRTLYQVN